MAYNIWEASEASIKMIASGTVSITTAAALDTFFGSATAVEGLLKDITVKEPIGDTGKVDLVGTDDSGYQV